MKNQTFTKGIIVALFALGIIVTSVSARTEISEIQTLFGTAYSEGKTVPNRIFAEALAEFLKLPSSQDSKCFKDLKKGDVLNSSICALKKAKFFTGGKKTKFKPKSKVTWKFAIASLCRAGKWTKQKTWKDCLEYAKEHNFLAPPLSKKPSQKKKITYGELSELMARSLVIGAAETVLPVPPVPPPAPEIPERETSELSFTPFDEKTIAANFFTGILLENPLPNHFYQDEVYFLSGTLIGATAEEVFVFLCQDGAGCENSIDFIEETTNLGTRFKIPIHFRKVGNFQIGVIVGRSGQSRVENISVLPNPPISEGGQAPTELSIKYEEGKANFSWNGSGNFARLTIFQNENRKDYLFRQGIKSFTPESKDFKGFQKGAAFWLVTQDTTASPQTPVTLTIQDFRKIEAEEIQVKNLQEVFSGAPAQFIFQAKSLAPISKKAALTLPDGQVQEINFAENDLSAGKEFKIESILVHPGTYIFEVNNPQGSAVVNVPIFVGTEIPLLPDYFALNPAELDPTPLNDIGKARNELLALINNDRKSNGLLAVVLINELNSIAQAHSANMVNQNFFGHVDPGGLSPEDRRKKVKYQTSIRENLAKAGDLDGVEHGLMRSPIHRAAIIDPKMTRVGLGIAKNEEGYFIVTQNFSADPVFQSDLSGIEDQLFSKSSEKRSADSLPSITHEATLRDVAREWSTNMRQKGFFGISDSEGNSVLNTARSRGIKSSLQIHIVKVSEKNQLEEELLKQTGLQDSENRNIGIGLAVSDVGELYMTTLYTP